MRIALLLTLLGCNERSLSPSDGAAADLLMRSRESDLGCQSGEFGCDVRFTCGTTTCAANQLCVHVCDCCGIPSVDGGPQPSGHDECITAAGQCANGIFMLGGESCLCQSALEAQCLCA
jgi:hypothetical protein